MPSCSGWRRLVDHGVPGAAPQVGPRRSQLYPLPMAFVFLILCLLFFNTKRKQSGLWNEVFGVWVKGGVPLLPERWGGSSIPDVPHSSSSHFPSCACGFYLIQTLLLYPRSQGGSERRLSQLVDKGLGHLPQWLLVGRQAEKPAEPRTCTGSRGCRQSLPSFLKMAPQQVSLGSEGTGVWLYAC